MKAFLFCLLSAVLVLIALDLVGAESRVARSPQFGGFSNAQASAQAGAFGGGFGGGPIQPYPGYGFQRPRFFPGRPGYGGGYGGFNRPGGAISISKSISISRGGPGGAQSSSSAGSFGK